ncbi:MAG: hypothetical protein ABW022_20445 [Actinoplanes sp.]
MADTLATPGDLAAVLQKSFTAEETATATVWLEAATAVVQAAAGQRIVRATTTDGEVWGGTDQVLVLPERPVISVASVTYAGSLLSQGTASGTWRRSAEGIWRDLGWAEVYGEPQSTLVTWTHGYLASDQGIQLGRGTVLSLARAPFENPSGVASEKIDDYSVAYEKAAAALEAKPSLMALLRKQYGRKAGMVRIV